mgnify:CR=1 FL=1
MQTKLDVKKGSTIMLNVEKSEIELLIEKLERNSSVRRNEKTFTFTTVLSILGIALAANNFIASWFYLLPYFIIVPYSAHISYYRIIHARINAYLIETVPEYRTFNIIGNNVPEGKGFLFWIISVLNNYEFFLLSIISMILFYSNYCISLEQWETSNYLICTIPIILSGFVFIITWYGKRYGYWVKKFRVEWKKEIKYETRDNSTIN